VNFFFETFRKNVISLSILASLIVLAGYLLTAVSNSNLGFSDIVILTLCFSAINILTLYIFFRGRKREPGSQAMHIMFAISLKMLIEMVLALLWFFVAKKNSADSLVLFFVLYLAFSLFSIFCMLKTLKNKSL